MLKKHAMISVLIATLFLPPAVKAQEYQSISAFDFLLDFENMIGQSVQIDDCIATAVSTFVFICTVPSEGSFPVGTINVELKNLPKRQLAYGLKKCSGFINGVDKCTVTIRGTAGEDILGQASIRAKQLEWLAEK